MDDVTKDKIETKLVNSLLAEYKSTRRWKNFRFIVWIISFLVFITILVMPSSPSDSASTRGKPYVALIRMTGTIMPGREFSAKTMMPLLNKAFRDKKAEGVVLVINSPGGSPVQSAIIHDKILQLKKKFHKKVVVVAEDSLASGAYLVATAADKIYVNNDTLTGSIGVVLSTFGFKDAIAKLGVSSRIFTAGKNKNRLDPFTKLKPADVTKIDGLLKIVHQNFINYVLAGRHGKLHGNPKELFSGDFWTGQTAVKLGLADGTANLWEVMQKTFNTNRYREYKPLPSFFEMITTDISSKFHLSLPRSAAHLQEVL